MKNNTQRNKKIIAILLLVMGLVLIFSFFKSEEKVVINEEKVEVPEEDTRLIIPDSYEVKTLKESSDYSTFDIKYPYFKNVNDEFNNKIKIFLDEQMEIQKKDSQEGWLARYNTQFPEEKIPKSPKNEDKWPFYADFIVIQSNNSYISFVLTYGGFTGGAHGYENRISYNYDLKNKKELKLKDIFSDGFDYLKYISEESRKELKKQYATLSDEDRVNSSPEAVKEYTDNIISMIEEGTKTEEENFNIFTFTQDKIKIYYAQYQVGPYVFGTPEIELDRK